MKKFVIDAVGLLVFLWLIVFLALGGLMMIMFIGVILTYGFPPPQRLLRPLIAAGVLLGLLAFILAARRRWLPGLRPPRTAPLPWGIWQAVCLVVGFILMQIVGAEICSLLIGFIVNVVVMFDAALRRHQFHLVPVHATVAPIVVAYLTSALWSIWYIRRRGSDLLHDGSARGIAWLSAARHNYMIAAFIAAIITVVMVVMFKLVPPNQAAVQSMPTVQAFGHPGWPIATLIFLALCIAPPTEEFVFRGGIFSALAGRLGPFWAGILTTAVFVAIHAPEKHHYPLGFIDVGMMAAAAAWLRVRAGSIRPGILLHVLYNFGAIIAAGLAH